MLFELWIMFMEFLIVMIWWMFVGDLLILVWFRQGRMNEVVFGSRCEWFSLVVICIVRFSLDRVCVISVLLGVVWVKLLFSLIKVLVELFSIVLMVFSMLWLLWCGRLMFSFCFRVLVSWVGGFLLIFMVWLFCMLEWLCMGYSLVLGCLILLCRNRKFVILWMVVIEWWCCVIFIVYVVMIWFDCMQMCVVVLIWVWFRFDCVWIWFYEVVLIIVC